MCTFLMQNTYTYKLYFSVQLAEGKEDVYINPSQTTRGRPFKQLFLLFPRPIQRRYVTTCARRSSPRLCCSPSSCPSCCPPTLSTATTRTPPSPPSPPPRWPSGGPPRPTPSATPPTTCAAARWTPWRTKWLSTTSKYLYVPWINVTLAAKDSPPSSLAATASHIHYQLRLVLVHYLLRLVLVHYLLRLVLVHYLLRLVVVHYLPRLVLVHYLLWLVLVHYLQKIILIH